MSGRLAGHSVLITGGCGDIGRATALACVREGALRVTAVDLPVALAARPFDADSGIFTEACDVVDRAAVAALFERLEQSRAVPDVVIVNAGVVESAPALELTAQIWQRTLDVNLSGGFNVAQLAAQAMVRLGYRGVLLFTGSWVGEVPSRNIMPYCVSKAGLQMLARCLALELAPHGIRANVVAPGVLDAGVSAQIFRQFPERRAPFEAMIPLGTLGTADQVADALVFLPRLRCRGVY